MNIYSEGTDLDQKVCFELEEIELSLICKFKFLFYVNRNGAKDHDVDSSSDKIAF